MSDVNQPVIDKKARNAEYQRKYRLNLNADAKEKINIEKARKKREKYQTDENYRNTVNEANKQKNKEIRQLAKNINIPAPPPIVAVVEPEPVNHYHCIYCNTNYTKQTIKKHLLSNKHIDNFIRIEKEKEK